MNKVEYSFSHERIFKAIGQMGLTPWKAAMMCGIKPSSFYQYAKGKARPNSETIEKMCNGLQVEPSYFFVQNLVS
jgi:transcriptional regulator with XRE-family HTH domain